jgi:carbon storage regulator CsrA
MTQQVQETDGGGYLVLTRATGQRIFIGADKEVEVKVCEIIPAAPGRAAKVKLGICAPKDVPVVRDDLKKAI